jgi:hypothetical protein
VEVCSAAISVAVCRKRDKVHVLREHRSGWRGMWWDSPGSVVQTVVQRPRSFHKWPRHVKARAKVNWEGVFCELLDYGAR